MNLRGLDEDFDQHFAIRAGQVEEQNSLSIRRELYIADWFLEVEMVQDCRSLEVDENRSTVYSLYQYQFM